MKTAISAWVLFTAMCLASGCTTRMEAYKSLSDLNQANAQAELVVTGNVTSIVSVEHFTGDEIRSANLGVMGTDCVSHEKVLMKPEKASKGVAPKGLLEFHYYGPCFHPTKGFKLASKTPAIGKGDHVKVYLVNRDGQWWLIAHDIENVPAGADTDINLRIFGGN